MLVMVQHPAPAVHATGTAPVCSSGVAGRVGAALWSDACVQASSVAQVSVALLPSVASLPCLQDCGVIQDGAAFVTAVQPNLGSPRGSKVAPAAVCADSCNKLSGAEQLCWSCLIPKMRSVCQFGRSQMEGPALLSPQAQPIHTYHAGHAVASHLEGSQGNPGVDGFAAPGAECHSLGQSPTAAAAAGATERRPASR